ncbi:HAD domain-containing protein [uncultured Deefgea sp.]|uniref:HAD domain-containing protein n=1 Tax=uncultured Deefgea sp. TaxID=1304914 RepID=UPI0025984BC3|nr:HAD domain-containing protein [uncultured Deefgea sp.]
MINSRQFIYLYLDFDGVLHADGEPAIDGCGRLCQNPNLFCWLKNLEEILDDFPDVKIIVSSDWRRLFDDETLIKLLRGVGWRFHGVVECIAANRYAEILQDASTKKIESWLALDDHKSVKAAAASDERLIFCFPQTGISAHAQQEELRQKITLLQKKIR